MQSMSCLSVNWFLVSSLEKLFVLELLFGCLRFLEEAHAKNKIKKTHNCSIFAALKKLFNI